MAQPALNFTFCSSTLDKATSRTSSFEKGFHALALVQIRKAKKDDMKHVIKLISELAVFEREPNAVVISSDDLVNDGFGDSPLFSCFVASVNDEISGIIIEEYIKWLKGDKESWKKWEKENPEKK